MIKLIESIYDAIHFAIQNNDMLAKQFTNVTGIKMKRLEGGILFKIRDSNDFSAAEIATIPKEDRLSEAIEHGSYIYLRFTDSFQLYEKNQQNEIRVYRFDYDVNEDLDSQDHFKYQYYIDYDEFEDVP